jgi:hypothetical protein
MARRLGRFEALSQDSVVEVEMEKDPLDTKSIRQEMEECIVLEEDPEMYLCHGWHRACACACACACAGKD